MPEAQWILSTRVSRLRFSLSAIGIVAAVGFAAVLALEVAANRLEASRQVYPYKWEDWLRYFVPSLWPTDGPPGLMLTGPSTARENFLLEEFARAFPGHRVLPAAMSLGTFRDITAGLEYLEAEYGRAALPRVVVLGIAPRFLAEIPRERPFPEALSRYGRHFGPLADSSAAFGLTRKPALAGIVDHARFRTSRQSPRYRAVFAWIAGRVVHPEWSSRLASSGIANRLAVSGAGRLLGVSELARLGPVGFAQRYISPYRYQPAQVSWKPEALAASLDDPRSWWAEVFHWNPEPDAEAIRARARSLIEFVRERDIELYVVNLPEHSALRRRTKPAFAARYDDLIRSAFGSVPFLDLRCFLPDADFLDAEHALWEGAKDVSARVIGFIEAIRVTRAGSGGDHDTVRDFADQWSRGSCALDP